jgi:hypothetical protein
MKDSVLETMVACFVKPLAIPGDDEAGFSKRRHHRVALSLPDVGKKWVPPVRDRDDQDVPRFLRKLSLTAVCRLPG